MKDNLFRFAPSPNGLLHMGHGLSALLNHFSAKDHQGRVLLRMENIDQQRCTNDFAKAIFDDLAWLDFHYDGTIMYQSTRYDAYWQAICVLADYGLIYPAPASRKDCLERVNIIEYQTGQLWPRDPDGTPHYPYQQEHRCIMSAHALPSNLPLRLNMDRALDYIASQNKELTWFDHYHGRITARPERWGDPLLIRRDSPASYPLSVVVDDGFQNITHIVRGYDLFAHSDLQCLLQALLGLPQPSYSHHPIILDENHQKLSKSRSSLSIKTLRQSGMKAEQFHDIAHQIYDKMASQSETVITAIKVDKAMALEVIRTAVP